RVTPIDPSGWCRNAEAAGRSFRASVRPECESRGFSCDSLVAQFPLYIQRQQNGNGHENNQKRGDVQRARDTKNGTVAEAVVEQVADYLSKQDSAHRAPETYQSGNGADHILWEKIGGQNHDQCRPRLLAEVRQAKKADGPGHGNMRHQNDKRHHGSAESERELPRHTERELAAHQVAGKSAAQKTPHTSRRAGHPGESSYGFDIKAASIVEILWEPEQVEKPRRVAQKFSNYQPPGFADAKQADPGQRRRRSWCWMRNCVDGRLPDDCLPEG